MRKIFFLLITLTITISSTAQYQNLTPTSPDPYSVITKVINYTKKNYIEGTFETGLVYGETYLDFSKWSKQFPNIIINYTALGRIAKEGGMLKNFRYKNTGNFNTKVILADWTNFDKNAGSGTFQLSLLDERYPNKIYLGIIGYDWKHYTNIELDQSQFNEIKNLLDYTTLSIMETNKILSKKMSVVKGSLPEKEIVFIEKELDNSENIFFQTVIEEDIYDERTKLYFHTKDLSKIYKIYIEDLEYTTENTFAFIISNWEYDSKNNCKNIFYKVNVTVKNNIPIFKLNKISEGICAG